MSYRVEYAGDFDEVLRGIGFVCKSYAHLESDIDYFVQAMSGMRRGLSNPVTSSMDLSAKIEAAKLLAFEGKKTDDWYKECRTVLNIIQNEIRPERNRYVHDIWVLSKKSAIRVTNKPKIKKQQAHKPEELITSEVYVSADDVWALGEKIVSASLSISSLEHEYSGRGPYVKKPLLELLRR